MSTSRVHQLRVVVEAPDFDAGVTFFRDVLGMPEVAAFAGGGDDRVAVLDAGRATLELASAAHKVAIDDVEAGGRPSSAVRLAFEVDDTVTETARLAEAGARVTAAPVLTPWRSLNSRLDAPAGLQITLFQETEDAATRQRRPGFDVDQGRGDR